MVHRVGRIVSKFRHTFGNPDWQLTLTVGIDATCAVQAWQVCSTHGAIVGGASPNHFIPIPENATKDQMKALLMECVDGAHGVLAPEVKCAVLSFQEPPPGMYPYVCMAGLPQTINASNNFGIEVIDACKEAAKQVDNLTILNSSTDGEDYEVQFNKDLTCAYLRGDEDQISLPDPNHNVKNLRYQLGGGSSPASFGGHVFDPEILKRVRIVKELWRIDDYALDALPLKLASALSVQKVVDKNFEDVGNCDVAVVSLLFV